MRNGVRKVISFLMFLCFTLVLVLVLGEPLNVMAGELPYDKLDRYIDKDGLQNVYDILFSDDLVKQDVKIVQESEAEKFPVAMVKIENGKVAYYVDGKPYFN